MTMMKSRWIGIAARIFSLLVVVAISVFVYAVADKAPQLAVYGYPGIFVISFLAYATVFFPAPGILAVSVMGTTLNPWAVGLVAGAGATLGEITGYLFGFSSQPVVERVKIYEKMVGWLKKNGALAVLVLSAVPNPFFDITGAAAGALKMPVRKFMLWTWVGETIKMLAFAFGGGALFKFLIDWVRSIL
jgi:membrane protein YqaA with SNARE-associated domain